MNFTSAVKKKLIQFFAMAVLMIVPAISFCQPPGPGDDSPDVPFDDNMNLAFLAIGLVFAAVIIAKRIRRNAVA
jgi:hypothetical protein